MGFSGEDLGSCVLFLMTPTLVAIVPSSHTKKKLKTAGSILKTAAWLSPAYMGWEFLFFFFFLILLFGHTTPHGMWDLSSLTRDGTRTPCIGSSVS